MRFNIHIELLMSKINANESLACRMMRKIHHTESNKPYVTGALALTHTYVHQKLSFDEVNSIQLFMCQIHSDIHCCDKNTDSHAEMNSITTIPSKNTKKHSLFA